ncbi:uncharacterized protein V1518DRAFT_425976 [Limtongia smithiae]|uniref:uncharacterized protein n=1 Tax=Limtongia smithiae TaxID=1125753 RepID=UPI0034CE03DD
MASSTTALAVSTNTTTTTTTTTTMTTTTSAASSTSASPAPSASSTTSTVPLLAELRDAPVPQKIRFAYSSKTKPSRTVVPSPRHTAGGSTAATVGGFQ